MLQNNITIDLAEDQSFALVSVAGTSTDRKDVASALTAPSVLTISHEVKGNGTKVARHLVKFSKVKEVNVDGVIRRATSGLHLVATVPENGVIDLADVVLMKDALVSFINATESGASESNFQRILRGES